MPRRTCLLVGSVLLTVTAGGGFIAGTKVQARVMASQQKAHPSSLGCPPASDYDGAYESELKARLAICMAFRRETRSESEQDGGADELQKTTTALNVCRFNLKSRDYPRRIQNCYAFKDMAPFYDHILGRVELSPEEEEASKKMSVEECTPIARWAKKADGQLFTCLRALATPDEAPDAEDSEGISKLTPPPNFKETYGNFPIRERPLVKACANRRDVVDALLKETFERLEHPVKLRTAPDGGIRMYPPGAMLPPAPEPGQHWHPDPTLIEK